MAFLIAVTLILVGGLLIASARAGKTVATYVQSVLKP